MPITQNPFEYLRFESEPILAQARRIVREWPADRMVFGTDYFWRDEARLMAWVKALRPDPAAQKLIFSENAQRLLSKDCADWECNA